MAVDMFMKIDGIDGESVDKTHEKEIDVLAWSFGISNSGTTHMGGGSGSGKCNVQDMSFTKYVDKATVPLSQHCLNGKHIPSAILVMRKAGEKPVEYLKITMTDLIITSYSTGGSGGEDRLTENVTLNFRVYEAEYTEQKADGSPGDKKVTKWDIGANAPK